MKNDQGQGQTEFKKFDKLLTVFEPRSLEEP